MAFKKNAEVAIVAPSAIVASATRITVAEAQFPGYRYTDESWQREGWEFYDSNGELSYAGDYVGSAYSLVRLTVNHVDDNGTVQGEVIDDPEVQAIASKALGGPMMRADVLRSIGCSFTVAGETYLIGRSGTFTGDEWTCVAPQYVRKWAGKVKVDFGAGVWETLNPATDVIMRIWTPHPARPLLADSATRSLLITLNQLQKLRMFMSAELNSRIANGCLYPLPDDLKFAGDADNGIPAGAPGVAQLIFEAMTSNISGYGTAAQIAPIIFEAPVESIKAMKDQPIRFDTPLSDKAMDYRRELIEDMARGLNVPAGQLSSTATQGMNHWCKTDKTEIFTRDRGWITQDQLNVGDIVLTLDHETGASQWQPVDNIYRADVVDEPMLSMKSASHSSLSTTGHRWPIITAGIARGWTTSGEGFGNQDSIQVAAPCVNVPEQAKFSDDFVRLIAAFTSDGTVLRRKSGTSYIRIAKFDEREIVELRRILTNVFGREGFVECVHPTRTVTGVAFVLGTYKSQDILAHTEDHKAISRDFVNDLTFSQARLLLESMIEIGDGVRVKFGYMFYQLHPERLNALEQAAIIAGLKVTRGIRNQQTGYGTEPLHWLRVSTARTTFSARGCEKEWATHTGLIWCPSTENRTWLARHEGKVYFTGNSAWWGTEEFTTKTIAPGFNRVCGALNTAYLYRALKLIGRDPTKFTFSFDLAPLTNSANKLVDTLNMYQTSPELISAEEVRRAGNFNDAAAPGQDEIDRRHMWAVVERDPTLLQSEGVREFLGLDIPNFLPAVADLPGDLDKPGAAPPPVPDRTVLKKTIGEPPTQPSKLIASMTEQPSAVVSAANALVLAALAVAGRKLRTAPYKTVFRDVSPTVLHTRIKVNDHDHANVLLASAWATAEDSFEGLDVDVDGIVPHLQTYTASLLVREVVHSRGLLAAFLDERGIR